jgi:hypothetical protein
LSRIEEWFVRDDELRTSVLIEGFGIHEGMDIQSKHNESDSPPAQVLLVHNILIGSYHHVERTRFGCLNELSVADTIPASVVDCFDLMLV